MIELESIPPINYDVLEERLKKYFKIYLYIPLIKDLGFSDLSRTIKNAAHSNPVYDALFRGQISYSNGTFIGKFNAEISKELKALGAKFDRKTSSYKLSLSKVPTEMKAAISASNTHFQEKMKRIDARLAKIIPKEFAESFKCEDLFKKDLWKADKSFQKNIKKVSVVPELTEDQRIQISDDWQNNTKLSIKGWTEDQIKKLRKNIYEDVMSGTRNEARVPPILKVTKTIQNSHEQAMTKAKFIARQETRLLMASFHQSRYEAAGSKTYFWRCVHRPHDTDPKEHILGNVRYSHGLLDGTEHRWEDPPVTTNPGQATRRNHPGQDYECRCMARAVIRKNG